MLISVLGVTVRAVPAQLRRRRRDRPPGQPRCARSQAIWGSLFTVLSFLTTTGFESRDWRAMQLWSDLPEPGTILLGVAVMGGGIATTAGGVKLLRLYALYRHGLREMDQLIHPSSLGRRGQGDQLISEGGPRIAFIFLMLFLISLALVMIALSATGLSFERSLGLAIAGLTTTGPAIATFGDGLGYRELSGRCAGDLLRGDDRRSDGGAGDHRALQPDLLAAVAAAGASVRMCNAQRENCRTALEMPIGATHTCLQEQQGPLTRGHTQLKARNNGCRNKQNLQDAFLNNVRKAKVPVTIFLMNGVKLQGVITWFDNFCVLLRRDGQSQLVYKHAISTVMPSQPITLYEAEDH